MARAMTAWRQRNPAAHCMAVLKSAGAPMRTQPPPKPTDKPPVPDGSGEAMPPRGLSACTNIDEVLVLVVGKESFYDEAQLCNSRLVQDLASLESSEDDLDAAR
jgi:hypothetical protein